MYCVSVWEICNAGLLHDDIFEIQKRCSRINIICIES